MRRGCWWLLTVGVLGCQRDPMVGVDAYRVAQFVSSEFTRVANDPWSSGLRRQSLAMSGLTTSTGGLWVESCRADSSGTTTLNEAGIPLDLVLTFPEGRCGTATFGPSTMTGGIRITALDGAVGARVTYLSLTHRITLSLSRVETRVDGVVELRALDDSTIRVSRQLVEVEASDFTVSTTTTRTNSLTIEGVPRFRQRPFVEQLAARTRITVGGAVEMARTGAASDTIRVAMRTVVPLEPDATCVSGFKSGEVTGTVTGTLAGVATLRYSCGTR